MRFRTASLAGWGNFPVQRAALFRPERRKEVGEILASGAQPHYIARGLGRSYGDTALNNGGGVILQTRLNRMLFFDPETGIIECEAGVSLDEILATFLPRGCFLPVTPGTRYVTVGGAIANDVHGKNHHADGTFGSHLLDLTLLTPRGEVLRCSPSEHPDIFWATVGGIGLTGIILTARFRLIKVPSAHIGVEYRRAGDLERALELLKDSEAWYRYSVAWIDCLAKGGSLGRSVLMLGSHAESAPESAAQAMGRRARRVPFHLPGWVLNPLSVRAFNSLYYHTYRDGRSTLPCDRFFYPLDAIADWNRLYGRRGFLQFQVAFPPDTALAGLRTVLERFAKTGLPSFLAVLKSCGSANPGLLSFPFRGYTLALDLPMAGQHVLEALRDLEPEVLRHKGRYYLGKDAFMSPEAFRAMYPRLGTFQAIKRRLDPDGLLSSSMSRRLRIMEEA